MATASQWSYPYQRLDTNVQRPSSAWRPHIHKRRVAILVAICVCLFVTGLFAHPSQLLSARELLLKDQQPLAGNVSVPVVDENGYLLDDKPPGPEPGPPSFDALRKWERELPQHNLDLPSPEGKLGRYVKFSNQITRLGWNNVLTEVYLNAFLAYESKRTYVFSDFVWETTHYPWSHRQTNGTWPPRTPLNALISGPISGGAWDEADDFPRSISDTFFREACPENDTRIITTDEVKPPVTWENAQVIFDTWKTVLLNAPERCIEVVEGDPIRDNVPQVFDLYLVGSQRILSLWDRFVRSPVSRLTRASPIVESAVTRNEYIFLPRGPRPASRNPYDRMLAMHVRRGDYSANCVHLAKWSSRFFSWSQLEFLPDRFEPPAGASWGENTPENEAIYMQRCLPSVEQMVSRARQVREDYGKPLDVLYLLTNEQGEWLDGLKAAMIKEGWSTIRTSRDLRLDQEQMEVNGAVDAEIARKAAVFIGNGWSSYTSNIVHRRLVDGRDPISIRFY